MSVWARRALGAKLAVATVLGTGLIDSDSGWVACLLLPPGPGFGYNGGVDKDRDLHSGAAAGSWRLGDGLVQYWIRRDWLSARHRDRAVGYRGRLIHWAD